VGWIHDFFGTEVDVYVSLGAIFLYDVIFNCYLVLEIYSTLWFYNPDSSVDQGIKFCSKFQSSWNAMKLVPLRPSRLPDFGGIFTLSNGLCMENISRSVRQVKQAKNFGADCTVRIVRTVRTV
jgi:hypothetical protein